MIRLRIATVVEGHGEVKALPVLLRRIAAAIAPDVWVDVRLPYRQPRSNLTAVSRSLECHGPRVGVKDVAGGVGGI
jgi:hypothetical protein